MPHDYVKTERRYRFNGRPVTRLEVRREIDKLTKFVQQQGASIADRYHSGDISIIEFEIEMRELLKAGHIVAASVGRGGRQQMTQSDWGRVGNKIKWQNDYLAKFARKLATGRLDKAYSVNRARAYASAIFVSYQNARMEAQTETVDGSGGGRDSDKEMLCQLVTNSEEGCVECAADEAEGWMPVSDMAEIGSRICGDWCRCEIEFSDEVDEL